VRERERERGGKSSCSGKKKRGLVLDKKSFQSALADFPVPYRKMDG
jgi:hypothetical protein